MFIISIAIYQFHNICILLSTTYNLKLCI